MERARRARVVPARRAGRLRGVPDSPEAVRPRRRVRGAARGVRTRRRVRSTGARPAVGLRGDRQVVGGARAGPRGREAARPADRGQVRAVQARHPVLRDHPGAPRARARRPRGRRAGDREVAATVRAGPRAERQADRGSGPAARADRRAATGGARAVAVGVGDPAPPGVRQAVRGVRRTRAPARDVHRRHPVGGRREPPADRESLDRRRPPPPADHRRVSRQRGRSVPSAGAHARSGAAQRRPDPRRRARAAVRGRPRPARRRYGPRLTHRGRAAREPRPRQDRRQPVLRDPVPDRAPPQALDLVRSRSVPLAVGRRAGPRRGLHRQHRGADARPAVRAAGRDPGGAPAGGVHRQHGGRRRAGDRVRARARAGAAPRDRAAPAVRERPRRSALLPVPPRSRARGGLRAAARAGVRADPPRDRPAAAREHGSRRAPRQGVRDRQPARPRRRADRVPARARAASPSSTCSPARARRTRRRTPRRCATSSRAPRCSRRTPRSPPRAGVHARAPPRRVRAHDQRVRRGRATPRRAGAPRRGCRRPGRGDVGADRAVHDARSDGARRRGDAGVPAARGDRLAGASDRRRGPARARSDLAAARIARDRGARRLAADDRTGAPRDDGRARARPVAGAVHRREAPLAGDLPDGEPEPGARQRRWLG